MWYNKQYVFKKRKHNLEFAVFLDAGFIAL
jgi:hypothetical protein